MQRTRRLSFVAAGLVAGIAVAVLAMLMAGAGHGWSSAASSAVAVIAAPFAAMVWLARRKPAARRLALLLVLGGVAADVVIALQTEREGWDYFHRAVSSGPLFVATWASLWFGWQLLACAALFTPRRASS